MKDYVIFTDSSCDIDRETLHRWQVQCVDLIFTFEGEENRTSNKDMPLDVFYQRMRDGARAKTSAANIDEFFTAFEPTLQQGKDILYIALSSGLSTTVQSARLATQQLAEKYPERTVEVLDSLAASAGVGFLVYLALQKKDQGADMPQTAAYIRSLESHHCIWFTVDDLEYLKRGGRVSPTVALIGGLLGIKPVLQMDAEGHLIKHSTARGRKKAIEALADKYRELANKDGETPCFISHAQCYDEAKQLADLLTAQGARVESISQIGPVIGSHSGPGTIALFFIGSHR